MPLLCRKTLFAKHFPFFMGQGQHPPLVGEILKIMKKEISHKIAQAI
jgi:hypothetical protein